MSKVNACKKQILHQYHPESKHYTFEQGWHEPGSTWKFLLDRIAANFPHKGIGENRFNNQKRDILHFLLSCWAGNVFVYSVMIQLLVDHLRGKVVKVFANVQDFVVSVLTIRKGFTYAFVEGVPRIIPSQLADDRIVGLNANQNWAWKWNMQSERVDKLQVLRQHAKTLLQNASLVMALRLIKDTPKENMGTVTSMARCFVLT